MPSEPVILESAPGGLTPSERETVAERLQEKLGARACEMCSSKTWAVGDSVVSIGQVVTGKKVAQIAPSMQHVMPLVYLQCTNCGNTKLFGVSALGVLDHLFPAFADDSDDVANSSINSDDAAR